MISKQVKLLNNVAESNIFLQPSDSLTKEPHRGTTEPETVIIVSRKTWQILIPFKWKIRVEHLLLKNRKHGKAKMALLYGKRYQLE